MDEFACKEDDFRRIYARDFEQAPNPIKYQIRASHIAIISASVGIVTCALSLRTTITDQALKLNGAAIPAERLKSACQGHEDVSIN